MKARGYKTADVSTNFTDIRVKLQKRDVVKVALVVLVVEGLLNVRITRRAQDAITKKIDSLVPDDWTSFNEAREKYDRETRDRDDS